jgi:hypothetical protein
MANLDIDSWQPFPDVNGYSTSGTALRVWYNRSFIDSEGTSVQGGNGTTGFYLSVSCTITSGVLLIPSFQIKTTLDAEDPSPQSIQCFARLYSNNTPKAWIFSGDSAPTGWVIPNPTPLTSMTNEQLALYNQATVLANPPQTFWTAAETQQYFDTLVPSPDASSVTKGISYLDYDPDTPAPPRAVGSNSPVVGRNSDDYASLSAAVTAIGSTPTTLTVTNALPSGAATSVPSTLRLRFVSGGSIVLGSGHTVTIVSDGKDWPIAQIFSGSGIVRFTNNKSIPAYFPQWWGAVGDSNGNAGNGTDDSAAWQACIDAVPDYGTIIVTQGFVSRLTTDPGISITGRAGISILGQGGNAQDAYLNSGFPGLMLDRATGTLIKINGSYGVRIEGLTIGDRATGSHTDVVGIDADIVGSPGHITSNITIRRNSFWIQSTAGVGLRIAYTSPNNCEGFLVERNAFYGGIANVQAGGSGSGGSNAFDLQFHDNNFTNSSASGYGINLIQGQAYVRGGQTQIANVAFRFLGPGSIEYVNIENSKQILVKQGLNTTVKMEGCRIGGLTTPLGTAAIATDVSGGRLIMIGNEFEADPNLTVFDGGNTSLVSISNGYPSNDQTKLNFALFNYGVTSVTDTVHGGSLFGTVFWIQPIIYPWKAFNNSDTTPSVAHGRNFTVSNSGATVITNFTDGGDGQEITLWFSNGNTTIQNNATIKLAGAANFVGSADDMLTLVLKGSVWTERSRSVN